MPIAVWFLFFLAIFVGKSFLRRALREFCSIFHRNHSRNGDSAGKIPFQRPRIECPDVFRELQVGRGKGGGGAMPRLRVKWRGGHRDGGVAGRGRGWRQVHSVEARRTGDAAATRTKKIQRMLLRGGRFRPGQAGRGEGGKDIARAIFLHLLDCLAPGRDLVRVYLLGGRACETLWQLNLRIER